MLLLLQTLLRQQNPEESSAKRFQAIARHFLGIVVEHGEVGEQQFDDGFCRSFGQDQEKLGRAVHRVGEDVVESWGCQSSVEKHVQQTGQMFLKVCCHTCFQCTFAACICIFKEVTLKTLTHAVNAL